MIKNNFYNSIRLFVLTKARKRNLIHDLYYSSNEDSFFMDIYDQKYDDLIRARVNVCRNVKKRIDSMIGKKTNPRSILYEMSSEILENFYEEIFLKNISNKKDEICSLKFSNDNMNLIKVGLE